MSARTILRSGALKLHLLPGVGGSIARFDRIVGGQRQALLRGTDRDYAGVLDMACFPLVPFCNRIQAGTFQCDGRVVRLTPNMAPDPSPLHGQGWLSAWQVESAREDHATLAFRHEADEWPWDYEARLSFDLDPAGLTVRLACRNHSDARMPCGLGLHPYFPCDARTVLDTRVECVWTVDEHVLPVAREAAEGRYDLRRRGICGQALDNGFGGWSGAAELAWPDEGLSLRLSSPGCAYFQVYAPREGGLFVAEPVQHANAALNEPQEEWESLGVVTLDPGQERTLLARFDVTER